MYARIITSQTQPGKTDEATRIWNESVVPILRQQKGFVGAYMVGDRATGKGVVMTLWEGEDDAQAIDTSGVYQRSIALFAQVLAGPPTREQYEVLVRV